MQVPRIRWIVEAKFAILKREFEKITFPLPADEENVHSRLAQLLVQLQSLHIAPYDLDLADKPGDNYWNGYKEQEKKKIEAFREKRDALITEIGFVIETKRSLVDHRKAISADMPLPEDIKSLNAHIEKHSDMAQQLQLLKRKHSQKYINRR